MDFTAFFISHSCRISARFSYLTFLILLLLILILIILFLILILILYRPTQNTTSSYLFGRRHHLRAGPGASARRRLFTQDLAPENEDGGGGGGGGGGGPGDFKPPTSSASHIGPAMSWLLTLVVSTLVLLNALIH